jgi:hypothetical protein
MSLQIARLKKYSYQEANPLESLYFFIKYQIYSVEITYGINSIISKLMIFVENAETGQFLFLVILILSYFTCS